MKEIRDRLAEANSAMLDGDKYKAVLIVEKAEILVYGFFEILWIEEVKQFGLFPI